MEPRARVHVPSYSAPILPLLPNGDPFALRSRRFLAVIVGLSCFFAPTSSAQVDIEIEGYGLGGFSNAVGGQTLYGTKQGQIHVVNADEGAWSLLAVRVSLQPYGSSDPEYSDYLQLIESYPWLVSSSTTVANTLGDTGHGSSIVGLVDSSDLSAAGSVELLVRPEDLAAQIDACVDLQNPEPDDIKDYGQAILLGETGVTWKSRYPTWSGEVMESFWLPTYARPISGVDDFTNIHWFRMMETACIAAVGYQQTIAFTRSADVVTAASLGLHLHVQLATLQGIPPLEPTSDPETTPGLENVTVATLPRFKVSLPITIAVPYTPPFLPGQYVPYEPGVVNIDVLPGSTMIAAIGVTTSATHAVFSAGGKQVQTQLFRFGLGGSLAVFVVPTNATTGYVEFEDLDGEDESAAMPIKEFWYDPPVPLLNDAGDS